MPPAANPDRSSARPAAHRATDLPPDARACVVGHEAEAGRCERLSAMGLGIGAMFRVLRAGTSMTVRVGETTLALGPEWASALTVVRL